MVIPELRKIIDFMNLKMNVIDIHIFEMALISYANAYNEQTDQKEYTQCILPYTLQIPCIYLLKNIAVKKMHTIMLLGVDKYFS